MATEGICLDLEEIKKDNFIIKFYIIGSYSDIDYLLNNFQTIKNKALKGADLIYENGGWVIKETSCSSSMPEIGNKS